MADHRPGAPDADVIDAGADGAADMVLELPSQARFLAAARGLIIALSERLGFSEAECGRIALALDEALCNIINHGYDRREDGPIWLRVWVREQGTPEIRMVLDDRARQVDLSTIRSRDLEEIRPGGLGVHIIQQVMDEVRYEHRAGGGMRLTMIKRHADEVNDLADVSSSPDP